MISKDVRFNQRRTSLRDAQKQLTRQRLIAAGHRVFTKSGYIDTTIRDITEMADVNRATFYQHFADKAAIFHAVIEYQLEANAMKHWETLDAALIAGSRASIRKWLGEAAQWWIDNAAFLTAWDQAIAVEPTVKAAQATPYIRIGNSLTTYQRSMPSEAERQRRVLLIEMLIIQLNGVLTAYLDPYPSQKELKGVLEALTDIWCASLGISSNS